MASIARRCYVSGRVLRPLTRLVWPILALVLAIGGPARAAPTSEGARLPERYRVGVLTFGPGDALFSKFGHNAILIEDRERQQVYNFGTFSFSDPGLVGNFLQGKLRYWLSVSTLERTLASYRADNRTVSVQYLSLTPRQAASLARALRLNAKPENRYYKYDYYFDNCSTRVRDALDSVLGGRVRKAALEPTDMTFREHSLRLTADSLPVYFALHFLLASAVDRPISGWEEAFLPRSLAALLERVPADEARGALVNEAAILFRADRAPVRNHMPSWTPGFALTGAAAAALLLALTWAWGAAARAGATRRERTLRWALGAALALLGFFSTVWGTISVLLWWFTDHNVAYRNENVLQFGPWALGLVFLAFGVVRRRAWVLRFWRGIALASLGASLLGVVIKLLPIAYQDNTQIIALAFPIWGGFAAASRLRVVHSAFGSR